MDYRNPDSEEIKRLVKYLSEIPFDYNVKPEEFGYTNPVLICLDAVLSINRKYYNFVVPRLKYFQANYPEVHTLRQISTLIKELGYEGFYVVWNYKHVARVKTLEELIDKFINYVSKIQQSDDLIAMKMWAEKSSVKDYAKFGVRGIGLATYQYIRMMLGVSTVKPDVHIKRAVSQALGRNVADYEAIMLIERASAVMNLPTTCVDHNLWRHFAADSDRAEQAGQELA